MSPVSLLGDLGANVLLPAAVGVGDGRGWVSSLTSPPVRIAAFDLRTGELTSISAPDEETAQLEDVSFGFVPDGPTWVLSTGAPAVQWIAPGSVHMAVFDSSLTAAVAAVSLPGGRFALVGGADRRSFIEVYGESGALEDEKWLPVHPLSVAWDSAAGLLGVLVVDGADTSVLLLDGATLEITGRCEIGTSGETLGALGDGRWMVTSSTAVYVTDCADAPLSLEVGENNGPPTPFDTDRALVPDCFGLSEVAGERWSVARVLDGALSEVAPPFPTGRHACAAALDPKTGYVWLADEESARVLAVDPASGETVASWQTGVHVEAIAVVPGEPDSVVMTGRLSDSIGRVDLGSGAALRTDQRVAWPGSPTFVGDELWVLGQLDMKLYQVDPATLEPLRVLETGFQENLGLVLGDLAWDEVNGCLWASDGMGNEVVAVDPESGEVIGTWTLAGDVPGPDAHGRVEVLAMDGAIITINTFSGWLTRIEPDSPASVASQEGSLERWSAEDDKVNLGWAWSDPVAGVVFAGSHAYSASDLAERPEEDVPADRIVGRRSDGLLLGWRELDEELVALDGESVVQTWSIEVLSQTPTIIVQGNRAYYSDVDKAAIGALDVTPL